MPNFDNERAGQIYFYNRILPRVDASLSVDDILSDSNDGVINGNLLEFKLTITNLNAHVLQCVKYLSSMRLKGKPVPATFLIVELTTGKTYVYKSDNYLEDIEKVYVGAASKGNDAYVAGSYNKALNYEEDPSDTSELVRILKENKHTKIHIDENCIVGWAKHFYFTVPNARKEDFIGDDTGAHKTIGEIRRPVHFKDYIYPYTGSTNTKFKYLMDMLNDDLQKKNLGAFYTPTQYAIKSLDLVRKAIERVPKGNDYVVIDRCAGTGQLESGMTDEELSHCIVSTIEYYEYKVLQELLGSKVREIIPPIETADTFNAGLVTGADALSKEYIENPIIKRYLNDDRCTIILFENPPYAETTSMEHQRKKQSTKSSAWKKSYVVQEMRKEVKGQALNDMGNAFIWSAFKYYLRQPTDSYIVYAPVKYWKLHHLINKKCLGGLAFNRKYFHTNINACIMCALWSNEDSRSKSLKLNGHNINKTGDFERMIKLPVERVEKLYSDVYYDKTKFKDVSYDGILTGLNGLEAADNVKKRIKPLYSDDMLGYLVADSGTFDNPDAKSSLLIAGRYNGNGFYLHKSNYIEKLPMFCASRYVKYNNAWTERARIMKSADGSVRFNRDVKNGILQQYLLKCLLFTCLEMQNHMRSFNGSDGRYYRNELCLDTTNGQTIASKDLKKLVMGDKEKALIKQWKQVLKAAKEDNRYKGNLTYGVYQLYAELDTSYKDHLGNTVWDNVELHSALSGLRALVKDYYITEIVPTLFKYEYLK